MGISGEKKKIGRRNKHSEILVITSRGSVDGRQNFRDKTRGGGERIQAKGEKERETHRWRSRLLGD